MAEEEFARQIQRLRGNNVTIAEMENRAEQFRMRLMTQPNSPPRHSSPGPSYPIRPTGPPSHLTPGVSSLGGVPAANPQTLTAGLHLGRDAPETSQTPWTRGGSDAFGSRPDQLRFAIANANEIEPNLEKDVCSLEQKRQVQSRAESLPAWDRYRVHNPISGHPLPIESWQKLLSRETLQALSLTSTPTRDDSMLDSWKGEVRKRKRSESSRSESDETSDYPHPIFDSFGVYRPVSYFEELGGLRGEQAQPKRFNKGILQQLRNPDSPQNNPEFEKAALESPWITKLTHEMYDSVESVFEKEEMELAADLSEIIVVKDTNKRRKVEEEESKPAGFRGTRFYRIMKATMKLLFSKNT